MRLNAHAPHFIYINSCDRVSVYDRVRRRRLASLKKHWNNSDSVIVVAVRCGCVCFIKSLFVIVVASIVQATR